MLGIARTRKYRCSKMVPKTEETDLHATLCNGSKSARCDPLKFSGRKPHSSIKQYMLGMYFWVEGEAHHRIPFPLPQYSCVSPNHPPVGLFHTAWAMRTSTSHLQTILHRAMRKHISQLNDVDPIILPVELVSARSQLVAGVRYSLEFYAVKPTSHLDGNGIGPILLFLLSVAR